MSIRAKFDGGKQYNRSQSGAWEGRCAGAGLQQNLGPAWGTVAWERATGLHDTCQKLHQRSREIESARQAMK